jgi:phage gpG-like protein
VSTYSGAPGARQLAANFDRAAHELRHGLNRHVLKAGLVVAGQAQRNVTGPRPRNLGVVTGRLRTSIHAQVVRYGTAKIGTNVEYAAIHEYGGMIFAKSGKWLRFQTRDGAWRTVDRVRIPARPYLHPALETKRHDVIRIIREVYRGPLRIGGQEIGV